MLNTRQVYAIKCWWMHCCREWLPLLRNCSWPMHSGPINSPASRSRLGLCRLVVLQSRLPPFAAGMRLKLPSCRLAACTAAAILSLSAVTGYPCVRAKLCKLCWSSQPYTAVLWAPSMPLHHGDLRHTPVTTHLAYVSVLLLFYYRVWGWEGWVGDDVFSFYPSLLLRLQWQPVFNIPLWRHVVFCNSIIQYMALCGEINSCVQTQMHANG